MQSNVRAILEGAFMSAIFLVLFFAAFYTPLSVVAAFALPVPFSVYGYRHDARMGALTVFVAVVLSFLFASFPGLLLALPAAVMGLVMGIAYRHKKPAGHVLILGTVIELVFVFVSVGLIMAVMQTNPVDDMVRGMGQISNQVITDMQAQLDNSLKQLPGDQKNSAQAEQLVQFRESLENMKTQIPSLISAMIPGLLISSALFSSLINHVLFRRIAQRMGMQIQALPALLICAFLVLFCIIILLYLFCS